MSLRLNKGNLGRIASFMIIIYPLIFRYESGLPYITLGEVILFILSFLIVYCESADIRLINNIFVFIVCIVVRVCISFFIDTVSIDLVGTGIRLAVLYCFIIILLPYFDMKKAKKYLDRVAVAVSLYEFLQIIAAHYNVYLTSSLPLLTSIRDVDGEVLLKAMYGIAFRPTSILGEPGELAAFLALPLSLNLLDDNRDKQWFIKSMFFSIALVATLSSTGIALLVIIWMLYFIKSKNTRTKCLVFIFFTIVGGYGFFRMGVWDYFVDRTFGGNGLSGIMSNTHYKDMYYLFNNNTNLLLWMIGHGTADPDGFLPGLFRLYYYMGIIGVMAYGAIILTAFKKGGNFQKELILVWIALNLGGAYMLGSFALPYTLFFLCGRKTQMEKIQTNLKTLV